MNYIRRVVLAYCSISTTRSNHILQQPVNWTKRILTIHSLFKLYFRHVSIFKPHHSPSCQVNNTVDWMLDNLLPLGEPSIELTGLSQSFRVEPGATVARTMSVNRPKMRIYHTAKCTLFTNTDNTTVRESRIFRCRLDTCREQYP